MRPTRDQRPTPAAARERGPGVSAAALILSLLVHAALFGAVRLRPPSSAAPPAAPAALSEPVDIWAGDTAALPAEEQLHEIQVDERPPAQVAAPQAAVAPAATAAPPPVAAPPTATAAPPATAPKAEPRAQREPAKPQAEPQAQREPAKPQAEDPYGEPARPSPPARPSSEPVASKPRAPAATSASAAAQAPQAGGGEARPGGPQGEFGAAGEGAVRSLGRAFTRAIPPACQADPVWKALPPGSAGTARIVVEIDGEGHVAGWKPEGGAVAPHFEGLARRTLALLRSGTFAVQGSAVTAGTQTLEISAMLSDVGDAPTDDLAWKFQDGVGAASFTQPGGRRVEIRVRVVRAAVSGGASPG